METHISNITFEQAKQIMNNGEFIMLDVREEEEYCTGHAEQAVLLPVDSIDSDSATALIPDHDTPVLLYCRTGRRSRIAAQKLESLGYTKLYDIGSLAGWPYGLDYGN